MEGSMSIALYMELGWRKPFLGHHSRMVWLSARIELSMSMLGV